MPPFQSFCFRSILEQLFCPPARTRIMAKKRKHTTYRSEFASLSPLQQQEHLSLLARLLRLLSGSPAPLDDAPQEPPHRRRIPGVDRPE